MINISARKFHLDIGGQDFTEALFDISNWNTSPVSESGLCKTSATLTLRNVPNLPVGIDDRANPSFWKVGQNITISIADSTGTLVTHPAGALRIVSAEYQPEKYALTIQAACLITVLSVKVPLNPIYAGVTTGVDTPRLKIITNLLKQAGITNINCPFNLPYPINYPIDLSESSSYVEIAGKMLFSAGYYAYINADEQFTILPIQLNGSTSASIAIGKDEIWYRRLTNNEGPREVVRVVGPTQVEKTYPSYDIDIHYGDASSVDPSLSGLVMISQVETDETWDFTSKVLIKTTTTTSPMGLALPNFGYASPGFKLQQIKSQIDVETSTYENTVGGKLLSKQTQTYKLAGAVLSEYFAYLKGVGNAPTGEDGLILAETTNTIYSYDLKHRLSSISTVKEAAEGSLLNGISLDWKTYVATYAGTPTGLLLSENTQESWKQQGVNIWNHKKSSYKSQSGINPGTIATKVAAYQKANPNASKADVLNTAVNSAYALVIDSNASFSDTSNSGQSIPPAPERALPTSQFSSRQIIGEAHFSQYGGNPYKERMKVYSVDYLVGETQAEDDITLPTQVDPSEPILFIQGGIQAVKQCNALAEILGQLLYGRFKGSDLGVSLTDDIIYGWHPLMGIEVTEFDGTVQVYAIDDSHWSISRDKLIANFGLIFLGTDTASSLSIPITMSISSV